MPTAYFGNGVNDTISVNLNNALGASTLTARALATPATTVNLPVAAFPIKANKDKGTFGGSGTVNSVTIQFTSLADPAQYKIQVDGTVTGQDLYFYVFENTIVGQDQAGRSSGVTITPVAQLASASAKSAKSTKSTKKK